MGIVTSLMYRKRLGTPWSSLAAFSALPGPQPLLGEALSAPRDDTVEVNSTPLANLALSPRTHNALWRGNVTQVSQVLALSDEELLGIRNFNEKCLIELDQRLAERNLKR